MVAPKGTGRIAVPPAARHSRISGVGGYRPERVVTNAEVCTWIDSSDEWIRERSGIVSRRYAAPDESVVDMAVAAARPALEMAGVAPAQIGAVIVSTVTHDLRTPSAAAIVADRLGTGTPAAFDISGACAGYCYGIALASDLVRGGTCEHVLVIGAEKLSSVTDHRDRGTAFIFGDGAGAAVVSPSDEPGIGPVVWGSEGDKWQVISQRAGWEAIGREQAKAAAGDAADWASLGVLDAREATSLGMQGPSVFRWAVWGMAPRAQEAVDAAGIEVGDLDAFIPHQANMRIVDAMVKQLGLPADIPVARDIAQTGNTSAASIPLATERMLREGEAPHGGLALQIGFGAGLVYAGQVVRLP